MILPKPERTIIPPPSGWVPKTLYVVHVSVHPKNPIWEAVFYSGFLNDGEPGGYNQIWSPHSSVLTIDRVHFLRALRALGVDFDGIREERL